MPYTSRNLAQYSKQDDLYVSIGCAVFLLPVFAIIWLAILTFQIRDVKRALEDMGTRIEQTNANTTPDATGNFTKP